MNRKKRAAPFELHDPIVPEVRGTASDAPDIVDAGGAPYEQQIGLTGRTVAPKVYIACGISGAVHHIVGMEQSGTVIAINPDKDAPIFEYADFGIVAKVEDISFN